LHEEKTKIEKVIITNKLVSFVPMSVIF